MPQQFTLRHLKALLKKHNIQAKVSGRGSDWQVEVPNEAVKDQLYKVLPMGVGVGGYRAGNGAWVLRPGYEDDNGDFNDSSSRHHYSNLKTSEDVVALLSRAKTAGSIGMEMLFRYVDRRGLLAVQQVMQKAGDEQSVKLLREVQRSLIDKLSLDRGAEEALNRLTTLASRGTSWDPSLIRNNIFKVANSLGINLPSGMFASERTAKTAGLGGIFVIKDDVEVIFNPFDKSLQVGMGGEWWAGTVRMGKNVFRHRKEGRDEAYRPVTVHVEMVGHALRFAIGGGFGMGTTVTLGFQ
mgnify:CR=1 FL=1|jgi:hypothetical protein